MVKPDAKAQSLPIYDKPCKDPDALDPEDPKLTGYPPEGPHILSDEWLYYTRLVKKEIRAERWPSSYNSHGVPRLGVCGHGKPVVLKDGNVKKYAVIFGNVILRGAQSGKTSKPVKSNRKSSTRSLSTFGPACTDQEDSKSEGEGGDGDEEEEESVQAENSGKRKRGEKGSGVEKKKAKKDVKGKRKADNPKGKDNNPKGKNDKHKEKGGRAKRKEIVVRQGKIGITMIPDPLLRRKNPAR